MRSATSLVNYHYSTEFGKVYIGNAQKWTLADECYR